MKKNYKKPLIEMVNLKFEQQMLAGSKAVNGGVTIDGWDTEYDDQSNP